MSKKAIPTALLLIAIATSCGLDTFNITEKAVTTIPGATPLEQLIGSVGFSALSNFDITQNQTLENEGVSKEQIDSVRVTRLTLSITSPASGTDFRFLDSLKFFVTAPGIERKLIASGGPFPADARTVDLKLEDVELEPYATAPSMEITTESTGRRPQSETTVEATIDLSVDVDIGGVACGG